MERDSWFVTHTYTRARSWCEAYLKFAGENTPIQSSTVGFGLLYCSVTHSVFCP